jgi:hypothetical protein
MTRRRVSRSSSKSWRKRSACVCEVVSDATDGRVPAGSGSSSANDRKSTPNVRASRSYPSAMSSSARISRYRARASCSVSPRYRCTPGSTSGARSRPIAAARRRRSAVSSVAPSSSGAAAKTASACRAAKARPRSEAPAWNSTGAPLLARRDVERPLDVEEPSVVVDRLDPVGVRVPAAGAVDHDRLRRPARPETPDDVDELLGTGVPVLVTGDGGLAEVPLTLAGRHDVPPGSAAGHEVESAERPGEVVRLVERGGRRPDEADVRRLHLWGRHRRRSGCRVGSWSGPIVLENTRVRCGAETQNLCPLVTRGKYSVCCTVP